MTIALSLMMMPFAAGLAAHDYLRANMPGLCIDLGILAMWVIIFFISA